MFELPEYATLARQMNESLTGRTIRTATLGNSPHKFVWYNRSAQEFERLTRGKTIGAARARGRWLTLEVNPGYRLVWGECGGKILYHAAGAPMPPKYHLSLLFEDGSFLTAMTTVWGAMELYEAGKELERQYIKNMRPTPVDGEFTYAYFCELVDELLQGKKRSVKSLLTEEQLIPGLGNAIAQDILFQARLHPRHPLADLTASQRRDLFAAIQATLQAVILAGGRSDETDLFGQPGGYARIMDARALESPCPRCGGRVEKIQYLGGSCYLCPACQV